MKTIEMNVPDDIKEFCRAVGRLCREYNLSSFKGEFAPPFKSSSEYNNITVHWDSGRHNADAGNISIHSQIFVSTSIDEE